MNSSPLGRYASLAATIISVAFVLAAIGVHLYAAGHPGTIADQWLDTTALVVVGIVLGIGSIGGTASSALESATAAHKRLDDIKAPPASPPTSSSDLPGVPS